MKLPVDVPQPTARDMSINLRRADARMTEHFLDDAQIRAELQKMRRKAVSQHVRRDVARDAGAADAAFDPLPHRGGREPGAGAGQKNIGR